MRWVRVNGETKVAPWEKPAHELWIGNEPLKSRQERIARAAGLDFAGEAQTRPEDPDLLAWDANVDLSLPTLKAFLQHAGPNARLGMVERPIRRDALIVEPSGPAFQGEPTRLFGVTRGKGTDPVIVPPKGILHQAPTLKGEKLSLYLTLRTAHTIEHWVHLLQANLAGILPLLVENLAFRPWNLPWAWLRSLKIGGRMAKIGRGCEIHPTARLEGCVLGDNVRVGAFSVLRGCVVGDGALIEDHVSARASVIGPSAHLANWCMFNFSVIGAKSSVGHIGAQASVIGEDTFVSSFATLEDLNLAGNVRVPFRGQLVDAGTPFLGCAVGDGAMIAAHVTLAPGRALPNGVRLLPDSRTIAARIPADLEPGSYGVVDGRVVRR